ncbi:Putative competence-damage inducible protein [Caulifigura coniformis]|uniref:CinA-like protein n=1 Tax=Caulifigura coniformis TaxID=2527983 RepID=A0A517SE67_9PLAN|nr:CinA family nicotinamide mononucleotide deamidase-related protein [Caulifigura coniformis]QDT54397.1 Putative competence-damage inducible protein [Caulifigura coniformis]
MLAEIVAIGSEITSGAKLDTNSQWLSQQLSDLGIPTGFHTSIADDLEANVACLRLAVERADVVIVSGGLGPTLDDLTRIALATVINRPLVLDSDALTTIEEMFRKRGRVMSDRNRIQAEFPEGSTPLANPIGTAPGIWLEIPRSGKSPCLVAALPGVPSELKRMFEEQVVPRLPATGEVIRRYRIHCYGCGESQADELLGDLTARGRDPEIGITAHEATITLRIEARGKSEAECQAKIDEAKGAVWSRLWKFAYGVEDEELETVVLRTLAHYGWTLGVADCATGGWLARALGALEAEYPGRALVVTGVEEKVAGVLLADLEDDIHEHRVGRLAAATREHLRVNYALATEPYPDLTPDEIAQSRLRIRVAVAGPDGILVDSLAIGGNPAILPARIGKTALDLLRRELPSRLQ